MQTNTTTCPDTKLPSNDTLKKNATQTKCDTGGKTNSCFTNAVIKWYWTPELIMLDKDLGRLPLSVSLSLHVCVFVSVCLCVCLLLSWFTDGLLMLY
jgi:hypothetical protein